MKDGTDSRSRGEVTETVEHHKQEMDEKDEAIGEVVEDIETVRKTLSELERGGTTEGIDDVDQRMQEAEDGAVEVYESEDAELDEVQEQSQEFGGELQERKGSAESDRDRITDASSSVRTKEALDQLAQAQDAARDDSEFLTEHLDKETEAFQESEQAQAEYRSRVSGGKGG